MRVMLVIFVFFFSLTLCAEAQTPTKKWTILVYLDGDNNLESEGIIDINEMEEIGSDTNINIVVQFDRITGYDFTNDNWTGTRRYYINKDTSSSTINSTMVQDLGEVNMGDGTSLTNFLRWGMTNYPAERYFVILWNHGGGWRSKTTAKTPTSRSPVKGVCWDDTNNDYLTMAEVNTSLNTIATEFTHPINIVGFDACIMGLAEVAYMVKGPVAYPTETVIFSQANEPGSGWDYAAFLASFATHYDDPALTLSQDVVDTYQAYYDGSDDTTLSVADMTQFSAFIASLNAFSTGATREWDTLQRAVASAMLFDDAYRDLIDITNYCRNNYFTPDLKLLAEDLYRKTRLFVPYCKNTGAFSFAHGLNIYFPLSSSDAEWSAYTTANAYMLNDVPWRGFLSNYFSADKIPPETPSKPSLTHHTDDFTVSWPSVSGATGYILREREVLDTYLNSNFDNNSFGDWSTYSASGYSGFSIVSIENHSPNNSVYSGSGNNLKRGLQSKLITIPDDSRPYILSLWVNYATEAGWDVFSIDVLHGSTLTNLASMSGTSAGWTQLTFDMSAYKGNTIRVVVRYETDASGTYTGVYLDDIQLLSATDTIIDTAETTSHDFNNKPEGSVFHYAVAAYDASRNISDFSSDYRYVQDNEIPSSQKFSLSQNYPNPFNPSTEISFTITKRAEVTLIIYSSKGQLIKTLISSVMNIGTHTTHWNGTDEYGRTLPSGVYYYQLVSNGQKSVRKMILLK